MTSLLSAWPFVAGVLTVLLSLIVSAHILLHKRDVRAAIGWIGLAWLAPVIGSLLYLVLGINRIKRRGTEIHASMSQVRVPLRLPSTLAPEMPTQPIDESLQPLARSVDRVTRNELVAGNRIEPLRNGDSAYPAMLAAIRSACSDAAERRASSAQLAASPRLQARSSNLAARSSSCSTPRPAATSRLRAPHPRASPTTQARSSSCAAAAGSAATP